MATIKRMPEEPNSPLSKEDRLIDEAALDWVIKQDAGLSPENQDAFFDWLAANPKHGEFLARHQRKWKRLDYLTQWRPEHSEEANPNLILGKRWKRPKIAWISGLAAAACAAFALLLLYNHNEYNGNASGILPTTGTIASGYQWNQLADGSVIELNGGAQVEYRFDRNERRLQMLSGEAHFIVAKDPLRPFTVNARGTQLRAVGTAFNVNLLDDSVEVLVTHGTVELMSPITSKDNFDTRIQSLDPPSKLKAGERTTVSLIGNSIAPVKDTPSEDTLESILAWKHQTLEFNATPIVQIIESFSRHNAISITIADPEIKELPLTAKFRSDNIEGFLRLLELTMPIEVIEQANGDFKLTKKS